MAADSALILAEAGIAVHFLLPFFAAVGRQLDNHALCRLGFFSFISPGSYPSRMYFLAVFSSPPAFAAAILFRSGLHAHSPSGLLPSFARNTLIPCASLIVGFTFKDANPLRPHPISTHHCALKTAMQLHAKEPHHIPARKHRDPSVRQSAVDLRELLQRVNITSVAHALFKSEAFFNPPSSPVPSFLIESFPQGLST